MIDRLFSAWERRLFSRTDDRVVRPFEWGLDWMDANGHGPAAPPDVALADWARTALADSPRFFDAPPTDDFSWEPESTGDRTCAGTVTFPSVITTPHPENNTVYGRLFPARRLKGGREDRRRAVVVLPQWNGDGDAHVGLCRLLAYFGVNALRLSLPYHDRRMPPILTRADFIVSANVGRTVQVCRQAVVDARRAVAWLAREGYERIGILGTSLGSCLAMLTTAHEPLIKAEALNHISRYFADVVWEGLSTEHVRAGLDARDHARPAARAVDADQPTGVRLARARQEDAAPLRPLRHLVPGAPVARARRGVRPAERAVRAGRAPLRALHDRARAV